MSERVGKSFYPKRVEREYEAKSMTLETSKNLGGVGALLIFLGPLLSAIPRIGIWTGILSLIGAILVLLALKGFADYYNDAGIFNNALYAIIMLIVGAVVAAALVFFAFVDLFAALGISITGIPDMSSLTSIFSNPSNFDVILRFAGIAVLALVMMFAIFVMVAFFLRKSLILMSAKTGVGLFGTTGLLLLLGAVFIILFGLGILLMWIATLLLAIAFFSVRTQQMPPPPSTGPPAPV